MIPIDFQVTCSKVKVKPLFSAHCVVCSISFDPFTWSIPYLVQGLPSMSIWFLLIFRSHVQRSRSNHSAQPTVLCAKYLLNTLLDQYQTWCRGFPQWVDDPYWFSGHIFKGQGQTTKSISFDPFTWSLPNLVQGLHPISRWSLFIFRSHVQRSRSNYSFEPCVLSTLYILIPWYLSLIHIWRCRRYAVCRSRWSPYH